MIEKLKEFIVEYSAELSLQGDEYVLGLWNLNLEDFTVLIERSYFDDITLDAQISKDMIWVTIDPLCHYYGIDEKKLLMWWNEKD